MRWTIKFSINLVYFFLGPTEGSRLDRSLDLDVAVEVVEVGDEAAAVTVEPEGKVALGDGNDAIKLTRRRRSRRDAPIQASEGEEDKSASSDEQFPDAQGVSSHFFTHILKASLIMGQLIRC